MTDPRNPLQALVRNGLLHALIILGVAIFVVGEGVLIYTATMKAQVELEAARNAPALKKAEADKLAAEAKVADLNQALTLANTSKVAAEAEVARLNQALTVANTAKASAEAKVAELNQALVIANTAKTTAEARKAAADADITEEVAGRTKKYWSGSYNAVDDLRRSGQEFRKQKALQRQQNGQ